MLQYSLKMSVSDQICLLCLTQVSTVRHSSSLLYDILRPQICLLCLPQVSTVHSSSLLYDILRPQICLLCFPQVSTVRHSSSPNLSPLSPSSLYCTTFIVTLKEVRIMLSLFCRFFAWSAIVIDRIIKTNWTFQIFKKLLSGFSAFNTYPWVSYDGCR